MTLEQFIKEYQKENAPRWKKMLRKVSAPLLGAAMALTPVSALAGQIIPYVTPDTQVSVTNPTSKTMTGEVRYAGQGNNPETATAIAEFSIPPFGTVTVENKLPPDSFRNEGSAYVETDTPAATPSDPSPEHVEAVVNARVETSVTTYNVPILDSNAKNNRDPQAGILTDGNEEEVLLSGDSTSTNTIDHKAYGPDGTGPANAEQEYAPPGIISNGKVNEIFQSLFPPNSTDTMIPKYDDQSKAFGLLVYKDLTSGDQRLRKMQNFTPAQQTPADVAKAYVDYWMPPNDTGFYLNNLETRAMINGDGKGTPSYAQDLATILATSQGANGQSVDQLTQWLKDQTDCDLSNGELCSSYKPLVWNNSGMGTTGFSLAGQSCDDSGVSVFSLDSTNAQEGYSLVKNKFLWRFVMNNPELYGGTVGGLPDMNHDSEWNIGGTDSYQCP